MISSDFLNNASASLGEQDYIGVLDIGTSKVSCFIARPVRMRGESYGEIIGVGHQVNAGIGAAGVAEVSADLAVRAAVDKARRMAGAEPSAWHVAVSGRHITCRRIGVDLEVAGHQIMEDDLQACYREGARLSAREEMVPLHIWPSLFSIDGLDGVRDPRGLHCEHLSVEMVALAASQTAIRNLTACLGRCRLKVAGFIAAPYAASSAVLHEEEISLGVLCLDMGANLTSFTVHKEGGLVFAGAVPLGSDHITRDIALAFGISPEAAERTKTVHGTGYCAPGDDLRFVTFDNSQTETSQVSVTDLAEVIGPRLEEILRLVFARIADAGLDRLSLRRAVITGGGSQLQGIADLSEQLHDMKVRIGRPLNLHGAPLAAGQSAFAVCAGMVEHLGNKRVGTKEIPHLVTDHLQGLSGHTPDAATLPRPLQQAASWLRAHF